MEIRLDWGTGRMVIRADKVIEDMSIPSFRKWAKLFAQWGTKEQHTEFFRLLDDYITMFGLKRHITMKGILGRLIT